VVVTGFGPSNLTWIENSNSIIREFAQKNSSRVVLADWNSTIREELQKNPTLMTSDGVHPDLSGQVIYARVITEAVAKAQS
jgi:possible lipopolysaccharide modification acyltransferase